MTTDIEQRRAANLKLYHERRAQVLAALGGVCAECGSTDDLHIVRKPDAEDFRVANLWSKSKQERERLYGQCQALCNEHAQRVMYRKGSLLHGAWFAAYKKKCQCEPCANYRVSYAAERRAKREAVRVASGRKPREVSAETRAKLSAAARSKHATAPRAKAPPKPRAPKAERKYAETPSAEPRRQRSAQPVTGEFTWPAALAHLAGRRFPEYRYLRLALCDVLAANPGRYTRGPDSLVAYLLENGLVTQHGRAYAVAVQAQTEYGEHEAMAAMASRSGYVRGRFKIGDDLLGEAALVVASMEKGV